MVIQGDANRANIGRAVASKHLWKVERRHAFGEEPELEDDVYVAYDLKLAEVYVRSVR